MQRSFSICTIALFAIAITVPAWPTVCPAQSTQPATVDLLAMGDWGTRATTQRSVAAAMAQYVKTSKRTFDGMLLLGDNTYLKPGQLTDEMWQAMFEKTYHADALDFPFYAALGNHDYSAESVNFQLDYARENPTGRWKLPSKWYRVDLPVEKPIVTLLVLDSCKQFMKPEEWQEELAWIDAELAKPRARWTVCTAHHPLFSNGDHGDNGVLQKEWGPLFRKHNVDFFVAGHDHDLQHLQLPGWQTSFVLAGGGGARVRPMRVDKRGPFSRSLYGFADFHLTDSLAKVRLVSGEGNIVHEFTRNPASKVNVNFTTPSDVAVPRTPRSINRPDAPTTAATSPVLSR